MLRLDSSSCFYKSIRYIVYNVGFVDIYSHGLEDGAISEFLIPFAVVVVGLVEDEEAASGVDLDEEV